MKNKIPALIQPGYIIAIAATVAVIMIVTAYIELNRSREDLFYLMEKNAFSLAESVEQSSAIIVLSTDEIENILNERLLNNALFIAHLDSIRRLSKDELRQLCAEYNISGAEIFNKYGNSIVSSFAKQPSAGNLIDGRSAREQLSPILRAETDKLVIGITNADQNYTVAVKRKHPAGGAVKVSFNADNITELRRSIGIGKLMKDIGDNRGVRYALLQDSLGIIAASGSIEEINTVESDPLLKLAIMLDSTITRVFQQGDEEIFEVIRPAVIYGEIIGIIRIGLSMDEIHTMETRMKQRALVISLVVFVLGALALTVIFANQNLRVSRKKIRAMETFTGSILENMQDAIITLDADNRVTIFNKQAERLFGIEASEVLNSSILDFTGERLACLKKVFSPGSDRKEIDVQCADKTGRTVHITFTYSDESTTAVVRDLTETLRLKKEVERREKLSAMGELAAGVAHEIRNPLNAISMIAQRYEKEFKPVRGIKEYKSITNVLQKESQRVNNIIQQFLRFARPHKLKLSGISAKQLVTHVATLFQSQAREKKVNFSFECKQDQTVNIDMDQMTQALLNLLQNGLDATEKGGKIMLLADCDENEFTIRIEDNGIGIPPERVNKIFDLYFTTKKGGTGIGLAITHQIISLHGGKIEVQSKPGTGTKFLIQIPLK